MPSPLGERERRPGRAAWRAALSPRLRSTRRSAGGVAVDPAGRHRGGVHAQLGGARRRPPASSNTRSSRSTGRRRSASGVARRPGRAAAGPRPGAASAGPRPARSRPARRRCVRSGWARATSACWRIDGDRRAQLVGGVGDEAALARPGPARAGPACGSWCGRAGRSRRRPAGRGPAGAARRRRSRRPRPRIASTGASARPTTIQVVAADHEQQQRQPDREQPGDRARSDSSTPSLRPADDHGARPGRRCRRRRPRPGTGRRRPARSTSARSSGRRVAPPAAGRPALGLARDHRAVRVEHLDHELLVVVDGQRPRPAASAASTAATSVGRAAGPPPAPPG